MIDLNALRVFQSVAALRSFSAAGRALGQPKSSVSRAIAQLEADLGIRLFQRSTREVVLTEAGQVLRDRSSDILSRVDETLDYMGAIVQSPRGLLKISAGIGFGFIFLTEVIPAFLEKYPEVDVAIDLSSRPIDLVSNNVDVAVRMGPLPDSQLVATRLGRIPRVLCGAPAYLERRGVPTSLDELASHQTIEMPAVTGRNRTWVLLNSAKEPCKVEVVPKITVNDMLTIHQMTLRGAGIACIAEYYCRDDIQQGKLVRILPAYELPPIDVNIVFPSSRELSPNVRAFVDFLKQSKSHRIFETGLCVEK